MIILVYSSNENNNNNKNNNNNNNNNSCILIDVAIPSDKNTFTKVSEKIPKYKDLEIEITRMWQMKAEIIPVVLGALRVIKKGSEKFNSKIPGNINLPEI